MAAATSIFYDCRALADRCTWRDALRGFPALGLGAYSRLLEFLHSSDSMTSLRTIAMLGLGLAMYHGCAYCQRVDPALMIDPDLNFSVVPSPERSELQEFAMSFHQDWDLVFPDFLEGAAIYLKGLSLERRAFLRSQFEQFLIENENFSPAELRKKWFGLGAEAWQPGLEVRIGLRGMLVLM